MREFSFHYVNTQIVFGETEPKIAKLYLTSFETFTCMS